MCVTYRIDRIDAGEPIVGCTCGSGEVASVQDLGTVTCQVMCTCGVKFLRQTDGTAHSVNGPAPASIRDRGSASGYGIGG